MDIKYFINKILPLDEKAMQQAKIYQDNLVKPIGSLGELENISIQLSGITGKLHNTIKKKAIIICCADNGVYEEKVSTAPQEVTITQTLNFFKGITGVAVLAKQGGIDLKVVDIGIKETIEHSSIIQKKVSCGTKNIALEPAMTQKELYQAVETGFLLVKELVQQGYHLLGTGEMGISNTTTADSVIIALCNCTVEQAVGKGAGLTEELFEHKKKVIEKALCVNAPNSQDPYDVVQKVGGLDIACLVGCYLGAAFYRIPIIIDGVISIAAALAAYKINPLCKGYMFPSHNSEEAAYKIASKELGITPYFHLKMRLGEGSGCPFTMYLIESAVKIINEMGTFEEGDVDKANYVDIR